MKDKARGRIVKDTGPMEKYGSRKGEGKEKDMSKERLVRMWWGWSGVG